MEKNKVGEGDRGLCIETGARSNFEWSDHREGDI